MTNLSHRSRSTINLKINFKWPVLKFFVTLVSINFLTFQLSKFMKNLTLFLILII